MSRLEKAGQGGTDMSVKSWNPYYVSYALAHGESDPDKMLQRDKERSRGGCMVPFMIWIQAHWREWEQLKGMDPHQSKSDAHRREFGTWLDNRVKNLDQALSKIGR